MQFRKERLLTIAGQPFSARRTWNSMESSGSVSAISSSSDHLLTFLPSRACLTLLNSPDTSVQIVHTLSFETPKSYSIALSLSCTNSSSFLSSSAFQSSLSASSFEVIRLSLLLLFTISFTAVRSSLTSCEMVPFVLL